MSQILPLKTEIENAIAELRKPKHHHRYDRAALRLEKLSEGILHPEAKVKRAKAVKASLIGGSGKQYRIKINLEAPQT